MTDLKRRRKGESYSESVLKRPFKSPLKNPDQAAGSIGRGKLSTPAPVLRPGSLLTPFRTPGSTNDPTKFKKEPATPSTPVTGRTGPFPTPSSTISCASTTSNALGASTRAPASPPSSTGTPSPALRSSYSKSLQQRRLGIATRAPTLHSSGNLSSDPTVRKLREQEHELRRLKRELESEVETLTTALSVLNRNQAANLDGLTEKWRSASRLAAEEVWAGARDRVNNMGGLAAWRQQERERKANSWGWDETPVVREEEEEQEEQKVVIDDVEEVSFVLFADIFRFETRRSSLTLHGIGHSLT